MGLIGTVALGPPRAQRDTQLRWPGGLEGGSRRSLGPESPHRGVRQEPAAQPLDTPGKPGSSECLGLSMEQQQCPVTLILGIGCLHPAALLLPLGVPPHLCPCRAAPGGGDVGPVLQHSGRGLSQ